MCLSFIKINKTQLAVVLYQIDRGTFLRWLEIFVRQDSLTNRRKFNMIEVIRIVNRLGNPIFHKVLSRRQIIDIVQCSYAELRKLIEHLIKQKKIPAEVQTLRKFPPELSKYLLSEFGLSLPQIKKDESEKIKKNK